MEFDNNYLSVDDVSKILKVSIDTLRRWDESGKLISARTPGGQRRYSISLLRNLLEKDFLWRAKLWAMESKNEPNQRFYCPNRAVFEARNSAMEKLLKNKIGDVFSIISSSSGEIGNNAFDHNLGKWPDLPGLYFNYDFEKRKIVLADRGLGILKTLQQTIPPLDSHEEALEIAFTEVITGRAPEKRGNGLKYVRRNVEKGYFKLTFQTGAAELILNSGEIFSRDKIRTVKERIPGCLALLEF